MYSYSPNAFLVQGSSTEWAAKWEKLEEILKPKIKGPFEIVSRGPQSFYQSSHTEKEPQGMTHPCTLNIQPNTVTSPTRIMVNKMC